MALTAEFIYYFLLQLNQSFDEKDVFSSENELQEICNLIDDSGRLSGTLKRRNLSAESVNVENIKNMIMKLLSSKVKVDMKDLL
jgi:hypothetical protein